jgi:hypothetical protein
LQKKKRLSYDRASNGGGILSHGSDFPRAPIAALLTDLSVLLPAGVASLVNPLVYTNVGELGDDDYLRYFLWINRAREVAQPAVRLGRYKPGALVDGNGPFHVFSDGHTAEEHVFAGYPNLTADFAGIMARRGEAVRVDRPCLFACHPGVDVWSHWLIDTLPRIVLVERKAPNTFTFVVPAAITDPQSPRFLAQSVLESLEVYGIARHRLLRLRPGTLYCFDALFDICGLSGDGMHPGVFDAMRALPELEPAKPIPLLAAIRGPGEIRPIRNHADVLGVLREHGALFQDPARTRFREKIVAFSAAEAIVGDLGSNLAMIIYARRGAAVITLAPSLWRDNYFTEKFQRLDVRHADVRGTAEPQPGDAEGHHPHRIDLGHLRAGLTAAGAARPGGGPVSIAGQLVPRRLGKVVGRIDFGAGGNSKDFRRGDFAEAEGPRTWSLGPRCSLVLPRFGASVSSDLWLELCGEGCTAPPKIASRPLGVAVNGRALAMFDIGNNLHVHVFVPREVAARSYNMVIEFTHDVCLSPAEMGKDKKDMRPLGYMWEFVALRLPG